MIVVVYISSMTIVWIVTPLAIRRARGDQNAGLKIHRAVNHHRMRSRKNAEQSFGLQAKLHRCGRNSARCGLVVLEDLKRLAERRCRDLSLTTHNPTAHK